MNFFLGGGGLKSWKNKAKRICGKDCHQSSLRNSPAIFLNSLDQNKKFTPNPLCITLGSTDLTPPSHESPDQSPAPSESLSQINHHARVTLTEKGMPGEIFRGQEGICTLSLSLSLYIYIYIYMYAAGCLIEPHFLLQCHETCENVVRNEKNKMANFGLPLLGFNYAPGK